MIKVTERTVTSDCLTNCLLHGWDANVKLVSIKVGVNHGFFHVYHL